VPWMSHAAPVQRAVCQMRGSFTGPDSQPPLVRYRITGWPSASKVMSFIYTLRPCDSYSWTKAGLSHSVSGRSSEWPAALFHDCPMSDVSM